MLRSFTKRRVYAFLVLFALLLLSAYSLAAQDSATDEPDVPAEATSEPFEMTFGAGPFNLMVPAVGLSDLSSYQATLTLSFEGTNAGQPEQWSRTYTMLVTQTPPARQLTIDTEDADQVYMAEIDNTFYERQDGSCIATAVTAEGAFAERWEPVGFLDSVIGADEAGTETINDVAADHYTFDEAAQGAAGLADSTGELWMASDGGYLVRYTLTTTGSADYFGEGIEGTLTWDYALTDVNQPLVIEVPEDCPAALLDVPVMVDAADVFQMPGHTSYTTPAGLEEVVAFYQEQVAASGGQPANPPLISENNVLFGFTQGDQPILVVASNDGGNTNVQIQLLGDPAELAITVEVPDTAPVQELPEECTAATDSIPMLPDAVEVASMPGLFSYTTSTSVADATAFYEEQFSALGAQVSSPMPASDMMALLDVRQGDQVISVTILPEGASTSVTITSTNPFAPPTDCVAAEPAPSNEAATEPETTAADCEGGIPMLPDAANVQNLPGLLSYTTNMSVADAVAFYEEQVAALGGQVSSAMPASNMMAMLDVRQGDQALLVMIASGGGVNSVTITSASGSPLPPPSDCVPSEPDTAQSETTSETSDAVCTVSSGASANQRSGPGTNFELAGTLAGGVNAAVDGQATGSDGFVWWRLGEGIWVRSDVVDETGSCEGVPVVQP